MKVKGLALVLALAGIGLMVFLVARLGAAQILRALEAAGWRGFAALVAVHAVVLAGSALAWRMLGRRQAAPAAVAFVWARLVRDAGSEVLPLSQIGGYALGARALALMGASGPLSAATTIVDVTLDVFSQAIFTGVAVLLLARRHPEVGAVHPLALGSVILVVLLGVFVALQRSDLRGARTRRAWRLPWRMQRLLDQMRRARELTRDLWRDPVGVIACLALHVVAWIGVGTEAWIGLHLMHVEIAWSDGLVLEGLLFAIRSLAFAVPSAVGVQEGTYLLLAGWLGLPATALLAFSLLKRARDLALGLPPLALWPWLEARFWDRAAEARAAAAALGDELVPTPAERSRT